jgi:hypothetical protein
VLGESIVCNTGTECPDLKGIRTEQLQRVIKKRDRGIPDAVVIHVGTNDIKRTGNLDHVMGDVYGLIDMTKTKFSATRVVLSGIVRRRDVLWQHFGAADSRLEWVANTLGVTFVDPNCWWTTGTVVETA